MDGLQLRFFSLRWIVAFAGAALVSAQSVAETRDLPHVGRPKRLTLISFADYFSTDSNYDSSGGSFEAIGEGRSYSNFGLNILAEYDLSRRTSVAAGFGIARAQSEDGTFSRANSGLTEVMVRARYLWLLRPVIVWPEFSFGYPMNRVDPNTDEALTGEGAMYAQPAAWIQKRLWGLQHYIYLGVRYQDEGRAMLLPWRLGTYLPGRGFRFGAELSGYQKLTDDEYSGTPEERTDVTDRVNGGSFRYYAVNPELMQVSGWVGYKPDGSLNFQLGGGTTINGKNSAAGYFAFAMITFGFATGRDLLESIGGKDEEDESERFKVESQNYDETLFREKKPRPVRRRRPRPRPKPEVNVEELLDETQQQLE